MGVPKRPKIDKKNAKNSMKESRYGLGPKVQSCSGRRDKSFRPKNGSFGHSGAKLVFLALKFKVD